MMFSPEFYTQWNTVFREVNRGELQTLSSVKKRCNIKHNDDLIGYIKLGMTCSNERIWQKALPRLSRMARNEKNRELCQRINTILQQRLIPFFERPSAASSTSSQVETLLLDKLSGIVREIVPDIYVIRCLNQEKMQGGKNTCGFHAFKNALCSLAAVFNYPIGSFAPLFKNRRFYENVESLVCMIRGESETDDVSEVHLRSAWLEIVKNTLFPFPGIECSLPWSQSDLSVFYTGWNISRAGVGLSITDSGSLDYLANLKELVQKEGPCAHAFIIGNSEHWFTVIYEKDGVGRVRWYGIDSNDKGKTNRAILEAVEWIKDAMENLDYIIPKLFMRSVGEDLKRFVKSILCSSDMLVFDPYEEKQVKSRLRISSVKNSICFAQRMGWMEESSSILIKYFMNMLAIYAKYYMKEGIIDSLFDGFSTFNPFVLDRRNLPMALLECSLPITIYSRSDFFAINDIPYKMQPLLIQLINTIVIEGPESDINGNLHAIIEFAKLLSPHQMEQIFTQFLNRVSSFSRYGNMMKFITTCLLAVNLLEIPFKKLEIKKTKLSNELLSNKIVNYFNRHPDFLKNLLRKIQADLETIADPTKARELALSVEKLSEIFGPLDHSLQFIVEHVKNTTTIDAFNDHSNPYYIVKNLKMAQQFQQPKPYYSMNVDEEVYSFDPGAVKELDNDVATVAHIPLNASSDTFQIIFQGIEDRINAAADLSDTTLERSIYYGDYEDPSKLEFEASLIFLEGGEPNYETYIRDVRLERMKSQQNGENVDFLTLKRNFIEDPFIQHLLQLPSDPDAEIEEEQFQLYCIIAYLRKQEATIKEGELLSEQEKMLLRYSRYIYYCVSGKKTAIRQVYNLLPFEVKRRSVTRTEKNIELFAHEFLIKKIEGVFGNRNCIKTLSGDFDRNQVVHFTGYLRKRFGKLLGLKVDASLDLWTYDLTKKILKLTEKKFLKKFYQFFDTQSVRKSFIEALRDKLSRIIQKPKNEQSKAEQGLFPYLTKLADESGLSLTDAFMLDDEGFVVKEVMNSCAELVCDSLKIFRKQNLRELPFKRLSELIQNSGTRNTIDLSECVQLSSSELAILSPFCRPLALEDLRARYPSLSIIDASMWQKMGLEVENPSFKVNGKTMISYLDQLMKLENVEKVDATLMLMPKELKIKSLDRIGIEVRVDREIADEIAETEETVESYWILVSHNQMSNRPSLNKNLKERIQDRLTLLEGCALLGLNYLLTSKGIIPEPFDGGLDFDRILVKMKNKNKIVSRIYPGSYDLCSLKDFQNPEMCRIFTFSHYCYSNHEIPIFWRV